MKRDEAEPLKYVRDTYGVPAQIGRRVIVSGRKGIISDDLGQYIGVNFDDDKPSVISPCHPTSEVEYLGMGTVRRLTRPQKRYADYLKVADLFDGFRDYLRSLKV